MKDFHSLFAAGIREIYAAEKEIIRACPGLIQAAKEPKLKELLRKHLDETKQEAMNLEKIAEELNIVLDANPSAVIYALLQKVHDCATARYSDEAKDAALIGAVRCIEHHEMAIYSTLRSYAKLLKFDFAEKKLAESLQDDAKADKKLCEMAEGTLFSKGVNKKACDNECS